MSAISMPSRTTASASSSARQANYQDYRDILGRGLPQADDVSPDYKTQASALLYGDLYDWDNLNQPDSIAEYLRDYY